MAFSDATQFLDEAKTTTPEEFTRRHPEPAFLLEPVFTGPEHPPIDVHRAAKIAWLADASVREVRVGRDPQFEIPIPHPRVSRTHATLQRLDTAGASRWVVTDQRSANGTTLRGKTLVAGVLAPLASADRLVLGGVVSVRPFFEPSAFHAFLASAVLVKAEKDSDRLERADPESETIALYRRLAAGFRPLGFTIEIKEGAQELSVETADGTRVRVLRDGALYVLDEWSRTGRHRRRSTISGTTPKLDETLKELVLEVNLPDNARVGIVGESEGPLDQTQTDDD
jgi:hypothetical protein